VNKVNVCVQQAVIDDTETFGLVVAVAVQRLFSFAYGAL